jgi:hypothetical protein
MTEITFVTVNDLIALLREQPGNAPVFMLSDAEGNAVNPLAFIEYDQGDGYLALVPYHAGWERYVGGDTHDRV